MHAIGKKVYKMTYKNTLKLQATKDAHLLYISNILKLYKCSFTPPLFQLLPQSIEIKIDAALIYLNTIAVS